MWNSIPNASWHFVDNIIQWTCSENALLTYFFIFNFMQFYMISSLLCHTQQKNWTNFKILLSLKSFFGNVSIEKKIIFIYQFNDKLTIRINIGNNVITNPLKKLKFTACKFYCLNFCYQLHNMGVYLIYNVRSYCTIQISTVNFNKNQLILFYNIRMKLLI